MQGIRTFEAVIPIDGPLDVPFEDWPANIQDRINEAMEALSKKLELPLTIVHAEYRKDHDLQPEQPGYHYLHVILSEVVMADERTIDPGRVVNTPKPKVH